MKSLTDILIGATLGIFVGFSVAHAQNSWQPFQPFKGNYLTRVGGAPYDYGAPAGSGGDGLDTGVVAHWTLEDVAGGAQVVDEVSAITCAASGGGLSYEQDSSSYSSLMDKCIKFGGGVGFRRAGTLAALAPGTADFMIEFVWRYDSAVGSNGGIFDTRDIGGVDIGGVRLTVTSSQALTFETTADDGTNHLVRWSDPNSDFGDTNTFTKVRILADRSGNAVCYFNGTAGTVVAGAASMATVSGKTIPHYDTCVGLWSVANAGANGWLNELRFTVGNIAINSGGPSGG